MTLHFQAQFLKLKCTENTKRTIKNVYIWKEKIIITEKNINDQKKKT